MKVRRCTAVLSCALLSALLCVSRGACAQSSPSVVSLDPASTPHVSAVSVPRGEASFANAPANFFPFASARLGEASDVQAVRLHFSAPTTLAKIESTKDFTIESGSSCVAGRSFAKGDTCIALVRFTPQGAGRRFGKLTITREGGAQPDAIGLGGYGYAPVLSFTPAVITTVPATYPGSKGLLSSAQNLDVDGGDTLYIADTGNGDIRYIDSSGTVQNAVTGATTPQGIATDNFGNIFFDNGAASGFMYEIYNYATFDVQASGTGTDTCTVSTPCSMYAEQLYYPGMMSVDHNNNLLFANDNGGAALSDLQPTQPTFINLYDPFPYQEAALPDGFAADYNDNLYTLWAIGTECEIQQQSLYDAEESNVRFIKVAGGRMCGFSGDGGEAANAEIGAIVGQMSFDEAGDMYFSDTNNQRVRMINAATGIINTIAGNGTAGYSGDNTGAKAAKLSYPTGVAVDSQGQVYIISGTGTTKGGAQVVRKVGPNGYLSYGNLTVGTSATLKVTVTNTGNSTMTLANTAFTGADASDFSIDPTVTSCGLTSGSYLYAGQACVIGIAFKPGATGSRKGNLVLLDNTVTSSNTVQLAGTGTASAPSFSPSALSFPSTTINQSASQTVTVTNKGNANLSISAITFGGTNPKMFTYTSTCSGAIAPKGTCTLQVTFKPTTSGSHSAVLNVTDNAPSSPDSVSVAGTGVTPASASVHVTSSANPATNCVPLAFSIAVTGTGGHVPTGVVDLMIGSRVLGSAALVNGAAILRGTSLPAGTNLVTVSYSGDATFEPSNSAVFSQTVSGSASCRSVNPLVAQQ